MKRGPLNFNPELFVVSFIYPLKQILGQTRGVSVKFLIVIYSSSGLYTTPHKLLGKSTHAMGEEELKPVFYY